MTRINRRLNRQSSIGALLVAATLLWVGQTAHAADPPPGPNKGYLFIETQFMVRTHDLFRGYVLENQGFILEPRLTVALATGPKSVVYFGAGQSFHSNQTLAAATATADAFFEANFFAGFNHSISDAWWMDMQYLTLTSPNQGFATMQELNWTLRYQGFDPLQVGGQEITIEPYAKVALELDGQIDGGTEEGTYLEVGVAPTMALDGSTLSIPMTLGYSLDNYYELLGDDDGFGYFDIGVDWSTPLADMPAEYGQWTFNAGVHVMLISPNAAGLLAVPVGGKKDIIHGTIGLTMNY
jgi:hypothetical protein